MSVASETSEAKSSISPTRKKKHLCFFFLCFCVCLSSTGQTAAPIPMKLAGDLNFFTTKTQFVLQKNRLYAFLPLEILRIFQIFPKTLFCYILKLPIFCIKLGIYVHCIEIHPPVVTLLCCYHFEVFFFVIFLAFLSKKLEKFQRFQRI
jgi:hypothetical protein